MGHISLGKKVGQIIIILHQQMPISGRKLGRVSRAVGDHYSNFVF